MILTRDYLSSALRIFFILSVGLLSVDAVAQKQLVLLKNEKVINRYRPGNAIIYKLKHGTGYNTSLIIDIQEFAFITTFDTIPFSRIDRVSLKGTPNKGANALFGTLFMAAGAGYYAVDQINSIIVKGQGYDSDPKVWKPAAILVGGGFLLKQLHKRSLSLHHPVKLFSTAPGKVFYQEEY